MNGLLAVLLVLFTTAPLGGGASGAAGLAPLLAAATGTAAPVDNQQHLYTLDGWGGLHPASGSPSLAGSAYWAGSDVARSLALFPDGSGGFVLDALGGLHPFGSANVPGAGAPTGAPYFGFDIARGILLAPWSSASVPAGWTLDGWGGVHAFGGAPNIGPVGAYWPKWDIARGLVVMPDSTASSVSGFTLDGWGGLHPFGAVGAPAGAAYFGWDIARAIIALPTALASAPAGYVVDGYGGLHGFGGAPNSIASTGYWPNWDITKGAMAWTGSGTGVPGGWTLDAYGGLHAFGSAISLGITTSAYWSGWDIARGGAGAGSGSGSKAAPPPPPPPPTHKIVVSLSQQHLWAYDNGRLWLETDVTTGRPELPTPTGDYHIFSKRSPYQMISPWPLGSPYWYPSAWISYAMEFIPGGYFLHDAPWRSWFGPGSQYGDGTHGCVNIPGGSGWGPISALWNWAQIGDEVVVQN